MNQTVREKGNPWRGAVVAGAIAAVFWGVILPIEYMRRVGSDAEGIYGAIALVGGATSGLISGALLGGMVGALAVRMREIAGMFTTRQPVSALVGSLPGALLGMLVVMVMIRSSLPWSLPLPLLLAGGALPGFFGAIAGAQHRRTSPATPKNLTLL